MEKSKQQQKTKRDHNQFSNYEISKNSTYFKLCFRKPILEKQFY